jgi:hypothetical protein
MFLSLIMMAQFAYYSFAFVCLFVSSRIRYSMSEDTKNETKWPRASVGMPWNDTTPGKAWAAAHRGAAYDGVGWYATPSTNVEHKLLNSLLEIVLTSRKR